MKVFKAVMMMDSMMYMCRMCMLSHTFLYSRHDSDSARALA